MGHTRESRPIPTLTLPLKGREARTPIFAHYFVCGRVSKLLLDPRLGDACAGMTVDQMFRSEGRNTLTFTHKGNHMNPVASTPLQIFAFAVFLAAGPAIHAQTSTADFSGEPDKSMAAAHESFVKGDMKKAGNDIGKASAYVKKEANQVAKDAKSGVTKAGAELDKLGKSVKAGTVKSAAELKKTFAKVDHALASAWHQTAAESQKAGKDATTALKQASAALDGAAKWSGNKLQEGAQASVDGLKKVGASVQTGAEQVGQWFQGIGDGIKDLGQKL